MVTLGTHIPVMNVSTGQSELALEPSQSTMKESSSKSAPISITFSYPYGNGFEPEFLESVIHLLLHEVSKPRDDRILGSILKAGSCYVGDNRDRLVIDFVNQSQDDWLLMIDPDVGFQPDILEKLKSHILANPEARIIAGRVDLLNGLPVFYKVDQSRNVNVHQSFPFDGLKEFDLVGTGIICLERSMLVNIHKKLGHVHMFSKLILESGLGLGDDFSFCARARSFGYTIYGAWDVYGQHYRDSVPVPRRYLEMDDLIVKFSK